MVVKLVQTRLTGIVEILKTIREQNDQNDLKSSCDNAKILQVFIDCQAIFIDILGNPQCKLFDVVEAITSQIYNLIVDRIIREEDDSRKIQFTLLLKVIKSHFKIMKNQKKCLTLSINYILIKLFKSKMMSDKQTEKLKKVTDEYI